MAESRHTQIPDRQTRRPDVSIRNHKLYLPEKRLDETNLTFEISDYTWTDAYVLGARVTMTAQ